MIHGLEGQERAMKTIAAKGKSASKIEQDLYSALELAKEMSLRGFSFLNVDLNRSAATKFTICDGKILPPFTAIDGWGPMLPNRSLPQERLPRSVPKPTSRCAARYPSRSSTP